MGVDSVPGWRQLTSHCIPLGRMRGCRLLILDSSYKTTNPTEEVSTLMTSFNLNHLPKAPRSNAITSGVVSVSTQALGWEHRNIQSVAFPIESTWERTAELGPPAWP